jgi:hypothetical protein
MRMFLCEICRDTVPESLHHAHHKIPKALGGPDTAENRADLCSSCHQNLHTIAYMIINEKRRAEIEPTVISIFPTSLECRKKLMEFAQLVAKEMFLKKETKKAFDEEMRTVLELPGLYMELIKLSGYDMPTATGRPAGVSRVVRNWIADQLIKKFPLKARQIEAVRKAKK